MQPTIRDRAWWAPKRGHLITPGRILHALIAFNAVIFGGAFGYTGLAIGSLGIVLLGWTWEALSPLFHWPHPWGDVLDFCAFEVGQLAGVAVWYAVMGG